MVSWAYQSQTGRHGDRATMEGLLASDRLWLDSIIAHRLLTERGDESLVVPPEMLHLFSMVLYNPDPQDTLPQCISNMEKNLFSLFATFLLFSTYHYFFLVSFVVRVVQVLFDLYI